MFPKAILTGLMSFICSYALVCFCPQGIFAADRPQEILKDYLNVLTNRVESLEIAVKSMPNNSQVLGRLEVVELNLELLKENIKDLNDPNGNAIKSILEELKATSSKIDAVNTEIKKSQVTQTVANKEMTQRIDDLEKGVKELKDRLTPPPAPTAAPATPQPVTPTQSRLVWEQYSWQCARCSKWHLSWRQVMR